MKAFEAYCRAAGSIDAGAEWRWVVKPNTCPACGYEWGGDVQARAACLAQSAMDDSRLSVRARNTLHWLYEKTGYEILRSEFVAAIGRRDREAAIDALCGVHGCGKTTAEEIVDSAHFAGCWAKGGPK